MTIFAARSLSHFLRAMRSLSFWYPHALPVDSVGLAMRTGPEEITKVWSRAWPAIARESQRTGKQPSD